MTDEERELQQRRDAFVARVRGAKTHIEALAVIREIEMGWYWCGRRVAVQQVIDAAEKMKR